MRVQDRGSSPLASSLRSPRCNQAKEMSDIWCNMKKLATVDILADLR